MKPLLIADPHQPPTPSPLSTTALSIPSAAQTKAKPLVNFDYSYVGLPPSANPAHGDPWFARICHAAGAHLPATPRNIGDACPISLEPVHHLIDAVLAEDGYVYDRHALKSCLQMSPLSPITRMPMLQTHVDVLGTASSAPLLALWHLDLGHDADDERDAMDERAFRQQMNQAILRTSYWGIVGASCALVANVIQAHRLLSGGLAGPIRTWIPAVIPAQTGVCCCMGAVIGVCVVAVTVHTRVALDMRRQLARG